MGFGLLPRGQLDLSPCKSVSCRYSKTKQRCGMFTYQLTGGNTPPEADRCQTIACPALDVC